MSSTTILITLLSVIIRWDAAVGILVNEISLQYVVTTVTLGILINTDVPTQIITKFTTISGCD